MKLDNSIVQLQPGMYIIRHPKGGMPPMSVGRALGASGAVGRVEVLSTPKTHGSILRDGADCIMMHVSGAPVDLLVTAYLPDGSATAPALRIDRVALDPEGAHPVLPATQAPSASSPAQGIQISATGLTLIGHIERIGDRVASDGQTLGDSGGSLRLEGFQVEWPDRPQGVDLQYMASVEGHGALPTVSTGNFCGTRAQGRRLTEVRFALVGPQVFRYQLEGQAIFSGGFRVPVQNGVVLGGPSGLEHLVGLQLRVVAATLQADNGPEGVWGPSSRTTVLKAKQSGKK